MLVRSAATAHGDELNSLGAKLSVSSKRVASATRRTESASEMVGEVRSRKRPVSSHDSVPVSLADEPSGAVKARKGSLRSVVQPQRWMSSALWIRNHIAPHCTKVLGVILVKLLLSILGWASIATHSNVMKALAMDTKGCSSPYSIGLSSCFDKVCTIDKINNLSLSMPMASGPILEPKHKIFLSHSGAQKEFAEQLCEALEEQFFYPFFDRRHESLPKGEQFPNLIVEAAKQCEMLIVVVSDEYFMSKWPMIELSAFVKAHKLHQESKDSTKGPKILPLFYGLSVDALKNATLQKKWIQQWETLAKEDHKKKIIVDDWKYALNVLMSFNGLPYDKNLKEIVAYKKKIVSHVSESISPNIRWDDSHVQGKSNMLKVINEKIEGIGIFKDYNIKVLGIYGVGGIGKTTLCKTLCNELSNKYEGRVCHIEFPNVPFSDSKVFFQKVLRDLTKKSINKIQDLDEGKCIYSLREDLPKQRTFLAIDNVWDNGNVIKLAKMLLKLPYHLDSLVVVTARSQKALELLEISGDAYLEMPDLHEEDALKLFLHHAIGGKEIFGDEEKHDILTCIRRCYLSKGDGQDYHYHPLALQVLALQLNRHGKNPSEWVKNLPPAKTINYISGENSIFGILKSSFDLLLPEDKIFFMDVGYFQFNVFYHGKFYSPWMSDIYKQDAQQVERLKQKGLPVDVDFRSKKINIHHLYREFSFLEAKGSLNELELGERKWLSIKNNTFIELVRERPPGYWHKLIRLNIKYHCGFLSQNRSEIDVLEDIKWDYFPNLEVLQLCNLDSRYGALKLEGLTRLKVLEILDGHTYGIEGLEKLKHLIYFTYMVFPNIENKFPMQLSNPSLDAHIKGQLPSFLKGLAIIGNVVLGSDLLARCYHLSNLKFQYVVAHSLDLSKCQSLESIWLQGIKKLQTLSGLATSQPSNLNFLHVCGCLDLVDIEGIEHLTSLKELLIIDCPKFEVPNLNGFNQLEVLTLRGIDGLTSLAELGDLPTLQYLDLRNCKHLMQLPDLSKSRNLQKLNLQGCFALKLHETEIQMLSTLPLLEPLSFYDNYGIFKIKLDLHQRKLLMYQNPIGSSIIVDEWEERDLVLFPIEIRKLLDPSFLEKEYMFPFFQYNYDNIKGKFFPRNFSEFKHSINPYSGFEDNEIDFWGFE